MTLLDILPAIAHVGSPLSSGARLHVPARVTDEADFRDRARRCRRAFKGARVVHCGRSPLTIGVARWARAAGLGIGVRSSGELAVALAAGTEPARIVVHVGSPDDLRAAVGAGVGRIVLDSPHEIPHVAGPARRHREVQVRRAE